MGTIGLFLFVKKRKAKGENIFMGQQQEEKKKFKPIPPEGRKFQKGNTYSCKYKEEYCDQLVEFFSRKYEENYPTFQRFAFNIGVDMDTLKNWSNKYPRFRNSYKRAKELQLDILTVNALSGRYNPAYAKFEAMNNHGMMERSKVENQVEAKVENGIDPKLIRMIEKAASRIGIDDDKVK